MPSRTVENMGHGSHLCHIYDNEEDLLSLLTPFVAGGISRGERVLLVVGGWYRQMILDHLTGTGIDTEHLLENGALCVRACEDGGLLAPNADPELPADMLKEYLESAQADGFSGLRVWRDLGTAAERTDEWVRILRQEAAITTVVDGGPAACVCAYDRRRRWAGQLLDILASHQLLAVDGKICDNFCYRPASYFVSQELPEARFEHWLEAVAERVRAEEDLKSTLKAASDVVDAIPCGLCTYRWEPPDRLILISCNPRVEEITGVKPEDIIGKELSEVWPGAREAGFSEALLEVMRTGRTYRVAERDYRDTRLEGTYRVSAFRMPGDRLGVAFEDVTELKKARAAAAAWQRDYAAVFNAVSDAILLIDVQNGMILEANQAVEGMFGYSQAEATQMRGDALSAGTPPYDVQGALERIALAGGGQPQVFEWRCRHRDGRVFWTDVSLKKTRIGERDCVIAVVRDIEARKRLEQQLLHAQKIEALGRVAGGVAHDFNNVLAAITGYTELALTHLDDSAALEQELQAVRSVALRAGLLTRQLLTFSRKRPLEPKPVNINTVILDMEAILGAVVGKRARIVRRLADDLDWTHADEGAVEQVVVNLVINARDAMPEGGTLTIETANVDASLAPEDHRAALKAGRHVRLSVSDTGVGMDEKTLQHIFEPFFTTKEVGQGTGLGLSTVYAVVKQSGGEVFFESQTGNGSTCTIYLPASPAPSQAVSPPRPETGPRTGTVLFVDDNETLRDLAREVLKAHGYQVLTAGDGRRALDALRDADKPADVLVTDVLMPGIDGRALAREVTLMHPGTQVVFTSGYPGGQESRELQTGQTQFLMKPFTIDALLEKVSQALARRKA